MAETASADDAIQIALHQRYPGAFDGDISAGAHGNTNIGGGKRGRIVHAVPRHPNNAAFGFQTGHHSAFGIGQYIGLNFFKSKAPRHGFSGDPVVTGHHDDADAFCLERCQGARRGLLNRIGNRNDPGRLATDCNKDGSCAFTAMAVGGIGQRCGINAELRQIGRVADGHAAAVDGADHTFAGGRIKISCGFHSKRAGSGFGDDGSGKRVLARALDGGGKAQQFSLGDRRRRHGAIVNIGCRKRATPQKCRTVKALVDHPAFNIAIFALLLNLPWEFGQMWLYAGTSEMSHLKGIQICMVASRGDCTAAADLCGRARVGVAGRPAVDPTAAF
jgi:hypothetical protein